MPTKKKPTSPSETLSAIVEELNKNLDAAESQLGTEAPSLTADQKRRVGRTRKGGERILQMIAELVKAHGLDSTALSSAVMTAQSQRSTTFASALARLQKLEKRVSDEQFVAQSDAWSMGLQFYALLQRRASTDGTLAASLTPITSFFNYRHESTKPTKLETRANAKLRDAQRLVARAKPRAAVLEEEREAPVATPSAPIVSAASPVTTTPAPAPVAAPGPVVAAPSIIQPAPAPSVTITPATTNGSNGSNGVLNGSNGYVNGASNGASGV